MSNWMSTAGEARQIDEIDRLVSAVTANEARSTAHEFDPSLLETIERVARLHGEVRPDAAFADRLAAHLGTSARSADRGRRGGRTRRSIVERVPPIAAARWRQPARRSLERPITYLAAAVVTLLAIGMIASMSGNDGSSYDGGASATVNVGTWPTTDGTDIPILTIDRIDLEPGTAFTDIRFGPTFVEALSGSVDVQSLLDGPERTIASGEIVPISSRSTLLLSNSSAEPASVLAIGIHPSNGRSTPYINDGVRLSFIAWFPLSADAMPDATVRLRRVGVAAGKALATFQTTGNLILRPEDSSIGITITGNDLPIGFESGVERIRNPGTMLAIDPNLAVSIRNLGDQALVLQMLTIEPVNQSIPPT